MTFVCDVDNLLTMSNMFLGGCLLISSGVVFTLNVRRFRLLVTHPIFIVIAFFVFIMLFVFVLFN